MKGLYEKSEIKFAVMWIVIYCAVQSLANGINEAVGIAYSASAALCIIQTVILLAFIKKNGLSEKYGLCKSPLPARSFLYYLPLAVIPLSCFWNGAVLNFDPGNICRVLCMLCVGFLEEIIFRGFLFKAMAKNNVKSAVIVSSVTFGIGHIVNLFNGSGMELVSNFCQMIFAVSIGFLFVTVFYRGGSLLPCIITHSLNNALNTFANDAGVTVTQQIIHALVITVVTVGYTLILTKTLPQKAAV